MNVRRLNWPLWVGFLLTLGAFMTYFTVFVWIPAMRNFPWANLVLFALAAVLLYMGIRRGFASDRPHPTPWQQRHVETMSARRTCAASGW